MACALSLQAQTIRVYKSSLSTKAPSQFTEHVCYDPTILDAISDSMFRQGNYKYLLVDLFRDGYITEDGNWYNVYPSAKDTTKGGIAMPDSVRFAYGTKWDSFVHYIGQPHAKYGYYIRPYYPIEYSHITNPQSELRSYNKKDLFNLRLVATGELKLYSELVKDSLTIADSAINFEFSKDGFYVQGKKLSADQLTKYRQICIDEFGDDFYSGDNRWSRGALAGSSLKKELEELEARIKAK